MATLIGKANRQLHLSSECVSSCLQDLFQLGYITYPRTDSTRIDSGAVQTICDAVKKEFGKAMLTTNLTKFEHRKNPATNENNTSSSSSSISEDDDGDDEDYSSYRTHEKPTRTSTNYTASLNNVEDAHEAIRPTNIHVKATQLGSIATATKQVYELIRQNTLAAFMIPMKVERVSVWVHFKSGNQTDLKMQLSGRRIAEAG
uniref:DNA topoisomerase 1 n=1 Tax=Lygus hesperus TaxID=30085 RepID=A0A0A9XFW5_LYGHE